MSDKGLIFNVQSYSVHDGPGIRTIIFMKGCPLKCTWCANPESQSYGREAGYAAAKCLGCGRCVSACPCNALTLTPDGIRIDRNLCDTDSCAGQCAAACPAQAMTIYGYLRTPAEILSQVERDSAFYARSGGGLTLSGGEPFGQPEFLARILLEAEKRAVNVAVETCGLASETVMLEACKRIDYLLFDIKHMDPETHKRVTGVSNEVILRNLRRIREEFPSLPIHVRTPVIPGVNDTPAAIEEIAAFAASAGANCYELLAFHRMGEQKYAYLDRHYDFLGQSPDPDRIEALNAIAARYLPKEYSER